MIHIRAEGEKVKQGFNFYPLNSNQFGVVVKINNTLWTLRYNKTLGKIKCHKHNTI